MRSFIIVGIFVALLQAHSGQSAPTGSENPHVENDGHYAKRGLNCGAQGSSVLNLSLLNSYNCNNGPRPPYPPPPGPHPPPPGPNPPFPNPPGPTPIPFHPTPSPFHPIPSPFVPTPSPFHPIPSPFVPTPSPYVPIPAPLPPHPSPIEPNPNPFGPIPPIPFVPTPSPYVPIPSPFLPHPSPIDGGMGPGMGPGFGGVPTGLASWSNSQSDFDANQFASSSLTPFGASSISGNSIESSSSANSGVIVLKKDHDKEKDSS